MNSPVSACIIEPVGEGLDFAFLLICSASSKRQQFLRFSRKRARRSSFIRKTMSSYVRKRINKENHKSTHDFPSSGKATGCSWA